jgi:hypothetical protein
MSETPGEAFLRTFGGDPARAVSVEDQPSAPGTLYNPYIPQSWDEAHALPSGAHFFDPAGTLRVRA